MNRRSFVPFKFSVCSDQFFWSSLTVEDVGISTFQHAVNDVQQLRPIELNNIQISNSIGLFQVLVYFLFPQILVLTFVLILFLAFLLSDLCQLLPQTFVQDVVLYLVDKIVLVFTHFFILKVVLHQKLMLSNLFPKVQ